MLPNVPENEAATEYQDIKPESIGVRQTILSINVLVDSDLMQDYIGSPASPRNKHKDWRKYFVPATE
jgi:hypothetical protein